ncbi:hypothetical protein [Hymenobacter cellulosivorans]|uniref:Uncharacterized protein n=1 Tax=Hymenobacter cellulosivorans TaxID=2932249 RepID=A0ABY4F3Q6_9BACT|nr:hypothetical protein [Hymenobacter cellulosivorans]UOQ50687.1 hypothetical protein MUN80_13045 [Hymenobacter cellulosivorans]
MGFFDFFKTTSAPSLQKQDDRVQPSITTPIAVQKVPAPSMTPVQEMVATLFFSDTIQQVEYQFNSGNEITPVDKFDMPFRLFKVNEGTINLELMLNRRWGAIRREEIGMVQNMTTYFKPIGIYKRDQASGKLHIIILNEFEQVYLQMTRNGLIKTENEVEMLSLEENAVIATFSMEAVIEARDKKDKKLTINGLSMEIFMTGDGAYPQMFLDDKYRVNGPLGAYFANGPYTLNPMMSVKATFDDLLSRNLLSAYKEL